MLRIEAPGGARRAVTTVGVDPRHPLAGGIEVNLDGELSLPRGEVGNVQEIWENYFERFFCWSLPS